MNTVPSRFCDPQVDNARARHCREVISNFFSARKFAPEIAPELVAQKHAGCPDSFYLIEFVMKIWSERRDSNPRPLHPQYSALPGCATLRPRPSYTGAPLLTQSAF